ncbi:hypothetical protein MKX03_037459 [Papaver bracteatum]|nr:hypothetical protein MKX03_037459 [Papaver bracteatum]
MSTFLILVILLSFGEMVSSVTNAGDVQILHHFHDGLENPEILQWPPSNDDPCGSGWPHIVCHEDRVTVIDVQNLGLKGLVSQNLNGLSNLEEINLSRNQFFGSLPTLEGLSKLTEAYFGDNEFDMIPSNFVQELHNLRALSLDNNPLNTNGGWKIPSGLQQSSKLEVLSFAYSNLVGTIPEWLGTMPSLLILKLHHNRIYGVIPSTFRGSSLEVLMLNDPIENALTGTIDILGTMKNLEYIRLQGNRFIGTIPVSISGLTSLKTLILGSNELSGTIPKSLTEMKLEILDLSNNHLLGPIPMLKSKVFTIANNSFCGDTPGTACASEVTTLIEFLAGLNYPVTLTSRWKGNDPCNSWPGVKCENRKVVEINLPSQHLNGTISPSIAADLKTLTLLNLKGNSIYPPIPKFQRDVSVLIGKFPSKPKSPSGSSTIGGAKSRSWSMIVVIILAATATIILVFLVIYFWKKRKGSQAPKDMSFKEPNDMPFEELCRVTENFSIQNKIGSGGYGIVYKAVLRDGREAAIKRMQRCETEKAQNKFQFEVDALKNLRHKNIVSLWGSCIEGNERLLVYEYMPQGDLRKHLLRDCVQAEPLSWKMRLNIALDVASGIKYLHHDAPENFVHCDIKSPNILLGADFRAKLSDFGSLKKNSHSSMFSRAIGTIGYTAPDMAGCLEADVYSFGVVLMELVTGKKPIIENTKQKEAPQHLTELFGEITPENVRVVSDGALEQEIDDATSKSMYDVVKLAVSCTAWRGHQRPDMVEVVQKLLKMVQDLTPVVAAEPEEVSGFDFNEPQEQHPRQENSAPLVLKKMFNDALGVRTGFFHTN